MIMKIICSAILLLTACFCKGQDYKLEGNEVKISQPILFETASSKLKPESDAALLIIKKYLDDKSYISLLRVEGHSDNTGRPESNQQLTQSRAMSICMRLVELGVDCKRLLPVGFGRTKPVALNDSPEGKAQNNRIVFVNASLRGHAIGGMPEDGGGVVAGDVCKKVE